MVSVKLILGLLAVIASAQCVPSPKQTVVDTVIDSLSQIVQIITKHVNSAIDASDPNLDIILAQFPVPVGDAVQAVRDDLRDIVRKLEERANVVMDEVDKAREDLAPTEPCTSPSSAAFKQIFDTLALNVDGVVEDTMVKYDKPITNIKDGLSRVVTNLRFIYDTTVNNLTACSYRGNTEFASCCKNVTAAVPDLIVSVVTDVVFLLSDAVDLVKPLVTDFVSGCDPHIDTAVEQMNAPLTVVGNCVAGMSPARL